VRRVREWRRRWRLWRRGECAWPGCREPRLWLFDYCEPHRQRDSREYRDRLDAEQFDREAEIVAEGIRRAKEKP
jgi:hypothetical protein